MRDWHDKYLPNAGPNHLQDLLGVQIEGGMYLNSHVGPDEALISPRYKSRPVKMPIQGEIGGQKVAGYAEMWAADLTLRGGNPLLSFATDTYKGQPAVVENPSGQGISVYVGAIKTEDSLLRHIMDYALGLSNVPPGPPVPEYVEIIPRGNMIFMINHRDADVTVDLAVAGTAIIGEFSDGVVNLKPFGVCVVRKML